MESDRDFSRSDVQTKKVGPEVGFEEIATDLLQAHS
jgi:hypothetical protein